MTRRIALLVALLAALLVVVLGSLLAGRYYYGTLVQTSGLRSESQKVEQKEEQGDSC